MAIDSDRLLAGLPDAAIQFFATFARFEYALKRAGYCRPKEVAEADWNAFARRLGSAFFQSITKSGAAETLLKAPPKKQVLVDKRLEWTDAQPPTNVQDFFGAICRVRNNLFHGGKFASAVVPDISRNQQLLTEAMWSLERGLDADADVRGHFESTLGV